MIDFFEIASLITGITDDRSIARQVYMIEVLRYSISVLRLKMKNKPNSNPDIAGFDNAL